jgi:hypothetical protein
MKIIFFKYSVMKSLLQSIIQNDSIKNDFLKPFGQYMYNELYFYILIVLVYCGLMFIGVLGILFYLINIHKKLAKLQNNLSSHDIELWH